MKTSIASVLALAAAMSASPAVPGEDAPDLPRHQLIFARHADDARTDYDIWRMCGDGTQLASLVVEPGHQLQISVSPDGSEFLYTSKVNGARDVFRRSFGRGEAVNLTGHPAEDSQPAFSPDGKQVAFFSDRDAEKPELYVLTLEFGTVRRLTHDTFHDSGASWSPDGSKIVFTRYFPPSKDTEGAGEIVQLDLVTGKETQLTKLGGYNGGVSHSPGGRLISFHRVAEGRSEIWFMEPDGSNPRAVTDTFIDEYDPEWSPDGNWIAFSAGIEHDGRGTFDLWLMRPDGSRRQVLNKTGNTEAWHEWRPGEHYCR